MKAYQITDIKTLMNSLLLKTVFDNFYLVEGSITTFATFQIQGRLQKQYYSSTELTEENKDNQTFALWSEIRPFCLELIKGKRTPVGFHFTFQLPEDELKKFPDFAAIDGLVLNIKYDGSTLFCTTATSLNIFTMDKTIDNAWDSFVTDFLVSHSITFEIL